MMKPTKKESHQQKKKNKRELIFKVNLKNFYLISNQVLIVTKKLKRIKRKPRKQWGSLKFKTLLVRVLKV